MIKKRKPLILKDPKEINSLNYLNDLAVKKIEEGDYPQAIEILVALIKKHPNYFLAYYNLGNLHLSLEQWQQAVFYFKEAIAIDDLHARSYLGLAIALSRLGKHEEAMIYYKKAYEIDPSVKTIALPPDLFG